MSILIRSNFLIKVEFKSRPILSFVWINCSLNPTVRFWFFRKCSVAFERMYPHFVHRMINHNPWIHCIISIYFYTCLFFFSILYYCAILFKIKKKKQTIKPNEKFKSLSNSSQHTHTHPILNCSILLKWLLN